MKTMLNLALLAVLAACSCVAGEFGGEAVAEVLPDAGVEAVYQAQAGQGATFEEGKTASEQLDEYVASKPDFKMGYDEKKKRVMYVSHTAFNVQDPRVDRGFLVKREMAAKQAVLRAKSDIIKSILVNMSAMDLLSVPGTDLHAALNEDYEIVLRSLAIQQGEVARLLRQVDAGEAEALEGVTYDDRVAALMDAAIKRLDGDFDAGAIEADKRRKFEQAKQRYADAVAQYETLRERAREMAGKTRESFSSSVKAQSSMPLFGVTVIQQAESWSEDDERYEVAVLVCWSVALEQAARAALAGDEAPLDKVGADDIQAWLRKQDLGAMVGPRQYLDDKGRRHFVGITARPVARDASLDQRNRDLADAFAGQMAVFSLFADIDVYVEAAQMSQTKSTGDMDALSDTQVAESFATDLSQRFNNIQVQGLTPLVRKKTRHAITGEDMHVSVYGISPASAAQAMRLERQAALAAINFYKDQAYMKARSETLDAAVEAAKTDPAARRAGAAAGRAEVDAARRQAASEAARDSAAPAGTTGSGSVIGSDVPDDF